MNPLTEKQQEELLDLAKPLIKWLNENAHPHCCVVVDSNSVELLEGQAAIRTDEFVKG